MGISCTNTISLNQNYKPKVHGTKFDMRRLVEKKGLGFSIVQVR